MMICPRCLRQYQAHTDTCPDDGARLREFRDQTSQLVGRILDGRWEILDKIGEGGMGEVYRARQLNVDRVVAVKVLRIALASTEQYVSRFFREADIAASVQHPHSAAIYDFGQSPEDQLLYIAMELLHGETLAEVARNRRLELVEVLQIASQVCAAMAAAHAARIVHRDIKPDNIFLVEVPEGGPFVKVLDFGIAKDLDAEKVTRTGQLFGTPEYMSPEQCEGKARVDGRSDLYALGCIIYELITSRPPFQRDSIIQTLLAQVGDEARPFEELGIPVPRVVEDLVLTLLEKHPDNRFPNAMAARGAIEDALEWLQHNPDAVRAYETVSAGLRPRIDTSHTVSYSELGHPLQLEGVLAESAKGALSKRAERRRQEDAERETVESGSTSQRKVFVGAGLAMVAVVAAVGWSKFAPAPPAPAPAPAPSVIVEVPPEPVTSPGELAATDAARRAATSSLIAITSFAASRPKIPEPEARPEQPRVTPTQKPTTTESPLLGIRTQTSIRQRFQRTHPQLLACYDRREEATDGGAVQFVVRIDPDGSVASAEVTSDALVSAAALACMKDVVGKVSFAPAAAASTFEKQLIFKPGQ